MSNLTFPEAYRITQAHEPETADAVDATSDAICCKNLKKLWIIFHHYSGGGDTDFVVTLYEGTDVAFATNSLITATCPIWYNVDTASADLLTRATDAAGFTIDTTAQLDQIWIMEWDPAKHTAGYDCIRPTTTGGNAANHVSILYIGEPRYQKAVVPTSITD